MGQPQPLFHLFRLFWVQYKNLVATRIQTCIVEVEGKDADLYAAPTALKVRSCWFWSYDVERIVVACLLYFLFENNRTTASSNQLYLFTRFIVMSSIINLKAFVAIVLLKFRLNQVPRIESLLVISESVHDDLGPREARLVREPFGNVALHRRVPDGDGHRDADHDHEVWHKLLEV